MASHVILRFADDTEAQTFVDDISDYDGVPTITPGRANKVHATVVEGPFKVGFYANPLVPQTDQR